MDDLSRYNSLISYYSLRSFKLFIAASITTVDKLVVDNKLAWGIASSVSIQAIKNVHIQVQTSIAALIHNSHRSLASCSGVRDQLETEKQ